MLNKVFMLLILSSIVLFTNGCRTYLKDRNYTQINIESLLETPLNYDENYICSSGYIRVHEGLAVYPTENEARYNPYERKVALVPNNISLGYLEHVDDYRLVKFCGLVKLYKGCGYVSRDGSTTNVPACVPFKKFVDVVEANFTLVDSAK